MTMECACCGLDRTPLTGLQCHDDVKVCRVCIGWLRAEAGVVDTTPILPVLDMDVAVSFYESAGFDVRRYEGGDYAFVQCDDESVFDLDVPEATLDRRANRSGCYLITPDVDHWYARLTAAGLPVTALEPKPWGMTEFTLTDPDRNYVRIGRPTDN